jgi:hypothetical protein
VALAVFRGITTRACMLSYNWINLRKLSTLFDAKAKRTLLKVGVRIFWQDLVRSPRTTTAIPDVHSLALLTVVTLLALANFWLRPPVLPDGMYPSGDGRRG